MEFTKLFWERRPYGYDVLVYINKFASQFFFTMTFENEQWTKKTRHGFYYVKTLNEGKTAICVTMWKKTLGH